MSNLHDLLPSLCHSDLMLATPGKLFSATGWIFELKHDGFRCLVTKCGEVVRLESRSGHDLSPYFPELVDEIRPIRADFVADSELVVLDEQGRPIWERLKARHVVRAPARIRQAAAADPAAIFAFAELDWQTADISYISFTSGWAAGLRALVKKLRAIETPRPLPGGAALAAATFAHGQSVVSHEVETVLANVARVDGIPDVVRAYRFVRGFPEDALKRLEDLRPIIRSTLKRSSL